MGSILGLSDTAASVQRKDWTLLAIALSRQGLAPVQLQKSLHLLRETYPRDVGSDFYKFRSMSSGNFSEHVYPDAQALASEGAVAVEVSEQEGWQHYSATTAGIVRAKEIESSLRPAVVHYLRRVVEWARMRSFDQLVRRPFDSAAGAPGTAPAARPLPPR